MLFTNLNYHRLSMCFYLGNLEGRGTWMMVVSIQDSLCTWHSCTWSSHSSPSQVSRTFPPANSRTAETLTLNKALILKYGYKMQLCYYMLGDTELPLNPPGPQLLYLQNESVLICDFSGTVQLYHSACHMESLILSYLRLSVPTTFCRNFILLKE